MRHRVLHGRLLGVARRHLRGPLAHELSDEHRLGLVVPEVVAVERPRVVLDRDELALRVEPAAHLECVRRALRVPRRLLVPHPLHAHGAAELAREERGLEARVVGRRAAVYLRAIHVDHAHFLARHSQELRYAVALTVRLHVVRVDRDLVVRRISERMCGANRGVALERHLVLGLDHVRCAFQCRVEVTFDLRLLGVRGCRATDEVEQLVGGGERRLGRFSPVGFQLLRGLNRLLLAFAHDGHVVAVAYDLHEAGNARDRRFVDAAQCRARQRRLHVARMQHARQLHVDGPCERAIHLARNVVALDRFADRVHVLHSLHVRGARGVVHVLARERHVEPLAAHELGVCHLSLRVGFHGDHGALHRECGDRHVQVRGAEIEQRAARFGCDSAGGPAVALDRIRTAGAALVRRGVRAAHDEPRLVVRDVELVAHHLAERRARALAAVGLADEERSRVVGVDHDPRVELQEIGVDVRPCAGGLRERAAARNGADADRHHHSAGCGEEAASRDCGVHAAQRVLDGFRKGERIAHFSPSVLLERLPCTTRLMACCTR